MDQRGRFVWYELMTTGLDAAQAFYAAVLGWTHADSGMPGMTYAIASVGAVPVGGMMTLPEHVRAKSGSPCWIGYVSVPDVDEAARQVVEAGGAIHREAADIPGVGRSSVAADPQGAAFVLFRGDGAAPEPPPAGTPGFVGWHELHAGEWEPAFAFYERMFGWRKTLAVDMGAMGTYQLFAKDGPDLGGMMTNPQVPAPFWLFYANVEDIDAAHARLLDAGGRVAAGPHQVPGGRWIVRGFDPQGASFAMIGPRMSA